MHRTVIRDEQDGYRYTARIELKLKRCRRRVDTFVSSARLCDCVWVCASVRVCVCMGVIQIEAHVAKRRLCQQQLLAAAAQLRVRAR